MRQFVNINLEEIYVATWVYEDFQYPYVIFYTWTNDELSNVGIYKVECDVPTPQGFYVTSYTYEIVGNRCVATPVFEEIYIDHAAILEQAKYEKNEEINELERIALEAGVPYDFGGVIGVMHIQVRVDDRVNLLGLRIKASEEPTFTTIFRSSENINVPVDATTMREISDAGMNGFIAIKATTWQYKDLVTAATTLEGLPELPETFIATVVAKGAQMAFNQQ